MQNAMLSAFPADQPTREADHFVPSARLDLAVTSSDAVADRVLVADDDEMDRRLTILRLGKAWPFERAIRVECARNGVEALERIRNSRFLLAVLDWNMPPLDGGDVLRTMRENGLRTPVVIVSGRHREDIAVDLQSLAATFLNKNELDPISFRGAITASMQLQEA
jgi:two-component system, sensor histidine kinase and response regulator